MSRAFVMRWVPAIALAALLVADIPPVHAEKAGPRSPAEAVRAAFDALREGKTEAYEALVPGNAQVQQLMDAALASLSDEDRKKALLRIEGQGGMKKMVSDIRVKALRRFERTRKQTFATEDWKRAAFVGLDQSRMRKRRDGPFDVLEMTFLVRSGDRLHAFGTKEAMQIDGRWYFPEGIGYRGPEGDDRQGERAMLREENAQLRQDVDRLRQAVDDKDAEMRNMLREFDEQRTRLDKMLDEREKRMKQALDDERRMAKQLIENLEAEALEFSKRIRALEDRLTDSKYRMEAAELKHTHAMEQQAAMRDRLANHESEIELLRFTMGALEPLLLPALTHKDPAVANAAETAALWGRLPGAQTHFQKLMGDGSAKPWRRLRAARYLIEAERFDQARPHLLAMRDAEQATEEPSKALLQEIQRLIDDMPPEDK